MGGFKRFEDIEAWQKARLLTNTVYQLTCTGKFTRDSGLRDQMRGSSVGVMSGIAEGFAQPDNEDFRRSLIRSKASIGNLKTRMYVALDATFLLPKDFYKLYILANQTAQSIADLISYLNTLEYEDWRMSTKPPPAEYNAEHT